MTSVSFKGQNLDHYIRITENGKIKVEQKPESIFYKAVHWIKRNITSRRSYNLNHVFSRIVESNERLTIFELLKERFGSELRVHIKALDHKNYKIAKFAYDALNGLSKNNNNVFLNESVNNCVSDQINKLILDNKLILLTPNQLSELQNYLKDLCCMLGGMGYKQEVISPIFEYLAKNEPQRNYSDISPNSLFGIICNQLVHDSTNNKHGHLLNLATQLRSVFRMSENSSPKSITYRSWEVNKEGQLKLSPIYQY